MLRSLLNRLTRGFEIPIRRGGRERGRNGRENGKEQFQRDFSLIVLDKPCVHRRDLYFANANQAIHRTTTHKKTTMFNNHYRIEIPSNPTEIIGLPESIKTKHEAPGAASQRAARQ